MSQSQPKLDLSALARATEAAPADADAAWVNLSSRLEQRRRRRRAARIGIPALLVAVVAAGMALRSPRRTQVALVEPGSAVESSASGVTFTLPDGVAVDLGEHSRINVEKLTGEEVRVALGRGHARFDVQRRGKRHFMVDVDGIVVKVVGTRFSVARVAAADGPRIEVEVERGIVEVSNTSRTMEPHRLHAGERFSALLAATGTLGAAASAAPAVIAPEAPPLEPPAAAATPAATVVRRAPAAAASEAARLLLEQGQREWRAGRYQEAATLYEEVLRRHPDDARAALAALELGRIRMDYLHDVPGAARSLDRAVRLAPGRVVLEDALARLVQATSQLGRTADCRRARKTYLARYPMGIHARAVSGACGAVGGRAGP